MAVMKVQSLSAFRADHSASEWAAVNRMMLERSAMRCWLGDSGYDGLVVLASVSGEFVAWGMTVCRVESPGSVYQIGVYVDESHRGCGYGSAVTRQLGMYLEFNGFAAKPQPRDDIGRKMYRHLPDCVLKAEGG